MSEVKTTPDLTAQLDRIADHLVFLEKKLDRLLAESKNQGRPRAVSYRAATIRGRAKVIAARATGRQAARPADIPRDTGIRATGGRQSCPGPHETQAESIFVF